MGKHTFGKRALADVAALGDCVVTGVRARRKKARTHRLSHSPAACMLQPPPLLPRAQLCIAHSPHAATRYLTRYA